MARERSLLASVVIVVFILVGFLILPTGFRGIVYLSFLFAVICLYPAYLFVMWAPTLRHSVVLAGQRLLQQTSRGRILREIDLTSPFTANCAFHDGRRALYRVRQGGRTMRFVVSVSSDGRVVKEALGLEWPPPSGVIWWP